MVYLHWRDIFVDTLCIFGGTWVDMFVYGSCTWSDIGVDTRCTCGGMWVDMFVCGGTRWSWKIEDMTVLLTKKKFWKWWGAESPANTIKSVLWTPSSWHFVAIFKVVMITKHCEGWKIHCTLLLKMLISSGFSSPRGTMFFTCFHRTCWLCNKQFMHWRDQCLTLFRLPTSVSNLYLYEPVAATVHTCPHKIINPQLDCKCETLYVALFVIYTWHKHHVQCNIPISPNH